MYVSYQSINVYKHVYGYINASMCMYVYLLTWLSLVFIAHAIVCPIIHNAIPGIGIPSTRNNTIYTFICICSWIDEDVYV